MPLHPSRRQALTALGLLPLAQPALARPALAQSARWPERPVEILVGFSAGGGTDVTARTFARFLEREIGGAVVVSNRPGASGEIALAAVARARADGHTLGITNMPGLVTLPIERRAPQFGLDDLEYVANLVSDPSAFSVLAGSPVRDLGDLVARAKQRPETITFGSTGVGTDDHLALVLFQQASGARLVHVPFPGAGPMRTAILGGQVEVAGLNVGEVAATPDGLRMIAQGGARRSPFAPDVPTLREAGLDVIMGSERGIVVAKGTPAGVVERLRQAADRVAGDPEFRRQARAQFTELDHLDGRTWRDRLAEADRRFRELWRVTPWSES